MVFTLMGPPLALLFPTGGVGMVAVVSSGIFGIYWLGLIGGESLADRDLADPAVAMWLANFAFLIVGLLLVSRMGHANAPLRGGGLDNFVSALRTRFRGARSHEASA
jgi:lipopolysaccharide export system permease protein